MKIERTTTGREHAITGLTDEELLTIETALHDDDRCLPGTDNYAVWNAVNDAVISADLNVIRPS